MIGTVTKGFLKQAEEATGSGNGHRHGAELSQGLVPFLFRNATLSWFYIGENFSKTIYTMVRESQGHCLGVNDPPKHEQTRGPTCVALSELLDRSGFLTILGIGCVQRTEDIVKGSEQNATYSQQSLTITLSNAKKIVYEHFHASELASIWVRKSWIDGSWLGHRTSQVVARW
jgi:hypothetical protein